MIKLREDGLIRSIGVSHFAPGHIERLERETGVLPVVNQIELHPLLPQDELRAFHTGKGIVTGSRAPLGRGSDLLGALPIPKSANRRRQLDHFDNFGFSLDDTQMAAVADRVHRRIHADPELYEEF